MADCPEDRCPLLLRDNNQCDPRCNIFPCDFDFGACVNEDEDLNGELEDLSNLIQGVFFGVLAIVGIVIFLSVVRGFLFNYNNYFGMSPYERAQVALGVRTRADITGEGQDATEDGQRRGGSVAEANAVVEANPLNSMMEGENGQELIVADTASQTSSRLPEAEEYGSENGDEERGDNGDYDVQIANDDEIPQPGDIVVQNYGDDNRNDNQV